MKRVHLQGLHCTDCSTELEDKLKQEFPEASISIDYEKQEMTYSKEVNEERLKRILSFEKVVLEQQFDTLENKEHTHSENQAMHDHSHHHGDFSKGGKAARNIKIVFIINLIFSIAEFIFGSLFNSAAILSDAVHDLGDSLSVGLAWFFQKISTKEANERYSFGHQRFSLMGALITGAVLMAGSSLIIFNTIPLLFNPEPILYEGMFWLSIVAIGANGFSAWLMSRGSSTNESMLNLHMLEDVLGWVGVLILSIVVSYTHWYILDPLFSIGLASFIILKTWPQFKETVAIFLEAVPKEIDMEQIVESLINTPSVSGLSHLHVWSIDGEENALAVTLSVKETTVDSREKIKENIRLQLLPYNITHSTIELIEDDEEWTKKFSSE